MKKSIIIITNAFPFFPGEQFLENEIQFWRNTSYSTVTILPGSAKGASRPLPESIKLDTYLSNPKKRLLFLAKALFSDFFYREILYLIKSKKIGLVTGIRALHATVVLLRFEYYLVKWLRKNSSVDTAYTFWNETKTYAACLAKRKGLIKHVVSRAHRYDVYEERRHGNYMPLKRQFVKEMDVLHVLSHKARDYMMSRYQFSEKQIEVSRLGVWIPSVASKTTSAGNLHLVSVSYCVPVKKIDKIIDSLKLFALQEKEIKIKWTHIGSGSLQLDLMEKANQQLGSCNNVKYEFKGEIPNSDVQLFYINQEIDFFINTSESEGIPVSIMEAMASGIPAIAPDIGGISELISNSCGILLSKDADIEEIVLAFSLMAKQSKNSEFRMAARGKIINQFNANKNYPEFVKKLEVFI